MRCGQFTSPAHRGSLKQRLNSVMLSDPSFSQDPKSLLALPDGQSISDEALYMICSLPKTRPTKPPRWSCRTPGDSARFERMVGNSLQDTENSLLGLINSLFSAKNSLFRFLGNNLLTTLFYCVLSGKFSHRSP